MKKKVIPVMQYAEVYMRKAEDKSVAEMYVMQQIDAKRFEAYFCSNYPAFPSPDVLIGSSTSIHKIYKVITDHFKQLSQD